MRRGMVDRRALDRFFVQCAGESGGAHPEGEICGLRKLFRSEADAFVEVRRDSTAVRRRIEAGRSDASTRAALCGHVRRNASKPGWRAGEDGSSLEIWVQEHQVAGKNQIRQGSTANDLEHHKRS